ncbi:MAG: late competence development ComFB family protein [Cyanobacteria bacterium J06636_16]
MIQKVASPHAYINVMELLVAEEVERQFRRLPERVAKYLKQAEVETCALNRLPTLYASSEKGLQHQLDRGRKELKSQIANAVHQALMAVQVDPIRLSQPIRMRGIDNGQADAVLELLSEWLRSPNLTWETALHKIQKLNRRSQARSQVTRPGPEAATQRQKNSLPPPPHRKTQPAPPVNQPLRADLEHEHMDAIHSAVPPSVLNTLRRSHKSTDRSQEDSEMISAPSETATPSQDKNTSRRPGTYGIRSNWSPRPQTSDTDADADVGFEDTYLR